MQSSERNSETISKDGTLRGSNPKSKSNLKPFQKGQSGNPNGRQKGVRNYSTLIDLAMERIAINYVNQYNETHKDKFTLEDIDIEQIILIQLINKARNGDIKAIQIFFDRLYGKPRVMPQDSSNLYYDSEANILKIKEQKKKALDMLDKWGSVKR